MEIAVVGGTTLFDEPQEANDNKTVSNRVNSFTEQFEKDTLTQTLCLTINFLPKDIDDLDNQSRFTLQEAWDAVPLKVNEILQVLLGQEDVLYAMVAIEAHWASKSSKNKEESYPLETQVQSQDGSLQVNPRLTPLINQCLSRGLSPDEIAKVISCVNSKLKPTVYGYPHFHIAFGVTSYSGTNYRSGKDFERLVADAIKFDDVREGSNGKNGRGKKIQKDNGASIIRYCLKNSRHKFVWNRLNPQGTPINYPVTLYNKRNHEVITAYFQRFSTLKSVLLQFAGSPQVTELSTSSSIPEVHLPPPPTTQSGVTAKRVPTTNRGKARKFVISQMEENGLGVCDGMIYRLSPNRGTRVCEVVFSNMLDFKAALHDHDEGYEYLTESVMRDIWTDMHASTQSSYPRFMIDPYWIEFKDFFFHIPTAICVEDPPSETYCYEYCDDISLEDVKSGNYYPENWHTIVKNSNLHVDSDFLTDLYKALLPKNHKDPILFLLGPPNSGKTTLVESLVGVLPDSKIAILNQHGGRFALAILRDKLILLADEAQGLKNLDESLLLKFAEGESSVVVEEKFKEDSKQDFNFNTIILANKHPFVKVPLLMSGDESPEGYINPAIEARSTVYNLTRLKSATPGFKAIVTSEKFKILLFLADHFFKHPSYPSFKFITAEELPKQLRYWTDSLTPMQRSQLPKKPVKLRFV